MKALIFFIATTIFLCNELHGENFTPTVPEETSEPAHYVVIGAFAVYRNAVNFTQHARQLDFDAKFDINNNRHLYYVFVLKTPDKSKAVREALRLRNNTEFRDAWVYGGALGPNSSGAPGKDFNPETEENLHDVSPIDSEEDIVVSEHTTSNLNEPKVEKVEPTIFSQTNMSTEEDEAINGKRFYFSLYRAIDGEFVQGDVDVIDTDRSRKMASFNGNEAVRVMDPGNSTGSISVICEVFGYRKQQLDLNYLDPESSADLTRDDDHNIVVPFELVRLQKGDIAVMYNVYFYKDAGIMRPESRYEVNSLLEMLNENPKYKIRIHGHTNGNAAGRIITVGDEKNFFSLDGSKNGTGTAKKLSEVRSEVIRDYLISEGIDPARMEIKAWGGKRPIHDKHSTRAQENVRVEVEILEDK